MKTLGTLLILSCLFSVGPYCIAASPLDSIVIITSRTVGSDNLAMGTGTLISANGDILTAYHVVQGAKSITVSTKQQQAFTDITVVKWDIQRDLAIIHINHSSVALNAYPLADPGVNIQPGAAEAYGHSASFYFSQFPASVIHPPILSGQIRDPDNNQQIFALNSISLIPIDITIFGGLSGGPLVVGNTIIGVISGSLTQGGSIAWAIPVTKDTPGSMDQVGKTPGSFNWPSLALMQPGSSIVRAQVSLGKDFALALDQANEAAHPLDQAIPAMEAACRVYRTQLRAVVQQADQRIAVDPTELVNTFTADTSQAPAWAPLINAASDCFDKWNGVNSQTMAAAHAGEVVNSKFQEFADQFPDTPANRVVDDKMGAQGAENIATQKAINVDLAKFQTAVSALKVAGNDPLPQARKYWTDSIALMDYVVPENGLGIMHRNHDLQTKIIAELELIFQLKRQ